MAIRNQDRDAGGPKVSRLLGLVKAHDHVAVRDVLKAHPKALNYRGKKGENLLHVCCGTAIGDDVKRRKASAKTAEALIDAGIGVDEEAFQEGEWKATPLWYAIGRGKNLTLAAYLIERGATPEYCMWAAAYNDDPAAVRLLCNAGANVDPVHGDTPLLFAVKWSRFAAAKALLECGANANVQDAAGKTALHYMLKKRSDPKYFRMFVKHGARVDIADGDGKTVNDLISRLRDQQYQEALKRAF